MGNSFKKIPYVKDSSNSEGKKMSSKAFRRKSKSKVKQLEDNPDLDIILPNKPGEVVDNWSVCDYKFLLDDRFSHGLKGKKLKLFK